MGMIHDILHYEFLQNALAASVLSGIACGIAGTYVVCRRQVFLSGGITHASFGGIGIAHFLGINPTLGAMVFALFSALGIEVAADRGTMREDSATGIVWSVGMAVGVIFLYLTPGYAPDMMSFLFGNILTVTRAGLLSLAILVGVQLLIAAFFLRSIYFVAFDRNFATGSGLGVKPILLGMAAVTAVTIVLSIKAVGIVLLISLLTIPATIVNVFEKSYRKITLWAPLVAVAGNLVGLMVSYRWNVPAGASAIIVLTLALIAVKLLPKRAISRSASNRL